MSFGVKRPLFIDLSRLRVGTYIDTVSSVSTEKGCVDILYTPLNSLKTEKIQDVLTGSLISVPPELPKMESQDVKVLIAAEDGESFFLEKYLKIEVGNILRQAHNTVIQAKVGEAKAVTDASLKNGECN